MSSITFRQPTAEQNRNVQPTSSTQAPRTEQDGERDPVVRDGTQWPALSVASTADHGQTGRSEGEADSLVEADAIVASSTADLREDLGPRTLHRKPKPKPGIPFKVLKAQAVAEAERWEEENQETGDPLAQMAILPPELLSRILAHLDAKSILRCATVCKAFYGVVRDEATWRLAFSIAFGIEAVEFEGATTPILRRVDASSWKQEYVQRSELLRRWRKARSPTIITETRVGPIHSIALALPHNFMLCGSLNHGVASRCDPFTGKVAKGFVDASGQVNAVGLAAIGRTFECSAMALEADATRIIWGFHTGVVAMTNLARQGTNPRGAIRGLQFSPRAGHVGPVLDVALPFGTGSGGAHGIQRSPERIRQRQAMLGEAAETFVTAGMDGKVHLWTPHRAVPLWTAIAQQNKEASGVAGRPIPVARVALHIESGTIVAATTNGDRILWTGIDVAALLNLPSAAYEEANTLAPTSAQVQARKEQRVLLDRVLRIQLPPVRATGLDGAIAPEMLVLDIEREGDGHDNAFVQANILSLCHRATSFERIAVDLRDPDGTPQISLLPTVNDSRITCARTDFDLTKAPTQRAPSHTMAATVTRQEGTTGTLTVTPANGQRPAGPALFAERKYLCAGTSDGKLMVWDWSQEADAQGQVRPWLCLDAHHMAITAIDLANHVIVVGCEDGTIKAFCPLSGQLIRTFNDRAATRHPAHMLAAGQLTDQEAARFHVGQIIVGPDTVVASIGAQVLAWRAERLRNGKANANRKVTSRTGRNSVGRLLDPKMQSMKEMERDVYETRQELDQEQERRLADRQRLGSAQADTSLDDMTEQEAFEYAMMLSRDEMEEDARRREAGLATSMATLRGTDDLDDALQQIALAESSAHSADRPTLHRGSTSVTDDDDYDDDRSQSWDVEHDRLRTSRSSRASVASSSVSPIASPVLQGYASPPSRAWDILQNAGSMASRNVRVGDAHSKVQAVHVPRSARLSASASSRRPSWSNAPAMSSLHSPEQWPTFEASSSMGGRSPSRLDLGSPVPSTRFLHGHDGGVNARGSMRGASPAGPTRDLSPSVAAPLAMGNGGNSTDAEPSQAPSLSTSWQSRSPRGAWAQGSPALRPVATTNNSATDMPSALSASRPALPSKEHRETGAWSTPPRFGASYDTDPSLLSGGGAHAASSETDRMDDDLRFAIELSLAEEQSRQDQQRG